MKRINMKLSDIIITDGFKRKFPAEFKMNLCRECYAETGKLDRDIVINSNGKLVDGYVAYLVALECGLTEVEVVCSEKCSEKYDYPIVKQTYKNSPTMYVFAHHPHGGKTYVWRIVSRTQNPENLKVGAKIMVNTKRGTKLVVVDDFRELNEPPVSMPVKKVIRCLEN